MNFLNYFSLLILYSILSKKLYLLFYQVKSISSSKLLIFLLLNFETLLIFYKNVYSK